jgi:predicted ArsR family transcriptional regulator
MYQDIKPRILEALRHGPLTIAEVAGEIDQAQFLVRAELKALKRDRLVTDELGDTLLSPRWDGSNLTWQLTDRGIKRLNHANQMRLV